MSTKPRFRAFTTVALMCAALATTVVATGVSAGAATTPLANLKITEANVSVKSKGATDFVAAKNGQALKQGDTIKTDNAGRAEIAYTDGSLTRMAGATVFTLSKLTNERGGRQTQGTLSVGETWNRAAKVSETGSFEVKAGGTTAAVEGTAFVATCTPKANGKQEVTCTFTAVVDDIKVDSDTWAVTSVTNAS
ncbi:MAG: FecR domain-containing protein [Acidimicrobiia bacterium]